MRLLDVDALFAHTHMHCCHKATDDGLEAIGNDFSSYLVLHYYMRRDMITHMHAATKGCPLSNCTEVCHTALESRQAQCTCELGAKVHSLCYGWAGHNMAKASCRQGHCDVIPFCDKKVQHISVQLGLIQQHCHLHEDTVGGL